MSQSTNMLNVGLLKNQADQFHRWKMPELEIANTGRGRERKTHLTNIEEISAAIGLSCDPRFLLKFMSIEMNTSTGPKSGDFYLKGVHDQEVLQGKIFDYIEHFALCPDCGKPRIQLSASKQKKSNKIGYKCGACGNRGALKGRHKNSGKMFKYMCNILKTDKKKNRKKKSSMKPLDLESSTQQEEEVVPAFTDADFDDWVMDPDSSRAELERQKEAAKLPPPPEEEIPKTTPRELLRRALNDPNLTLLAQVSEFQRILTARKIDDELKIARIVTDSTLDFSQEQSLLNSIQRYGVFLSWFCEDREKALMCIDILSDGIINNGLLTSTAEIFERMYDSQVLSPQILLYWENLPAEQNYILDDPNDVHEIKERAEPFIAWLNDTHAQKI